MNGVGIRMVVCGGQTGVDQAAADAAMCRGISYGGWCPKGRINENGTIDAKYVSFKEVSGEFSSDTENYAERTIRNIKDSDGTLIIAPEFPLPHKIQDGTILTIEAAKKYEKPFLEINLSEGHSNNIQKIIYWVRENNINILNIAGPRESNSLGIYNSSKRLIEDVIPYIDNKRFTAKL